MNKTFVEQYFKDYPGVDEFHFTTDGYAFKVKDDAERHAVTLADKKVETIKRGSTDEVPTGTNNGGDEVILTDAEKLLLDMELDSDSDEIALEVAKELGIEGDTDAEILEALKAKKEELTLKTQE